MAKTPLNRTIRQIRGMYNRAGKPVPGGVRRAVVYSKTAKRSVGVIAPRERKAIKAVVRSTGAGYGMKKVLRNKARKS